MKTFDHYEFAGILLPGFTLFVGIVIIFPTMLSTKDLLNISFGSFGIFVVVSYVLGHLVHALGNFIDAAWWKLWGGIPSDWIRTKAERLLSKEQAALLQNLARERLKLPALEVAQSSKSDWFAVTRQIYADVAGAGRASRIEVFNGNYSLHRGLASALICVSGAGLISEPPRFDVTLFAALASGLALYRMHRFGRHYARELFVQFLQLPPKQAPKSETEK